MIQLVKTDGPWEWNSFFGQEKENQIITIAHNLSLGKILEMTFGYTSLGHFVKKSGEVIGTFPMVKFGKKLVLYFIFPMAVQF